MCLLALAEPSGSEASRKNAVKAVELHVGLQHWDMQAVQTALIVSGSPVHHIRPVTLRRYSAKVVKNVGSFPSGV